MCRSDEYRCDGRLPRCVHRSLLCDRNTDCPLGDDETDCIHMSQCTSGFHFCDSKKSAPKKVFISNGGGNEAVIRDNRKRKLRLIREIGECVEIGRICDRSINCTIKNADQRERLCQNIALTSTTSTSLAQSSTNSQVVELETNRTWDPFQSLQSEGTTETSLSTVSSKPAFTLNQNQVYTEMNESSDLSTDSSAYSLKDIERTTFVSKKTPLVTPSHLPNKISTVFATKSTTIFPIPVSTYSSVTASPEQKILKPSSQYKKQRENFPQQSEVTKSMTHIEHVREMPGSSSFDFQPFFKPFFNEDQIPFDDFMKSAAKKKPTSQSDPRSSKSNNNFYFHKFMNGGGTSGASESGLSNGGFDYSKYMKGGGAGKSGVNGSTNFGSFNFTKFMNKGGAGQSNTGSNVQANNQTNSSGFNYSQYLKGGGSGSFDYSTYMNGKPHKETPKKGVKHKYHKADYLKFYEDISEEKGMKIHENKKNDDSIDFVAVDHRKLKQFETNQTKLSSLSNGTDEYVEGQESDAADSYTSEVGKTTTVDYYDSSDSVGQKKDQNPIGQTAQLAHPMTKWIPPSASTRVSGEKGNNVNVSKIIPKTMLNGYSYTHYGSGVFFINFGTIVNGHSNIMGSGNDVGNGNANGNNNGNTQGDNLRSNANNRHQELESKESK